MKGYDAPARLLNAVLILLLGVVLLACLTAPWIFNALIRLGRTVELLEGLRDLTFEQVISRLVLIYLVLGIVPAIRWGGVRSPDNIGLPRHTVWAREVLLGWCLGCASLVLLIGWAWGTGVFVWNPDPWGRVLGRFAAYLIGGLLVGWIEEILFRGILFNALKRVMAWWPAALVVSAGFAFVHFLGPRAPDGIVWGHIDTGFRLLPHSIYITHDMSHYMPFGFTLFVMSLVLCAFYQRRGNLYFIIGLHAGWVVILQGARFLFERDPTIASLWFGASTNAGRSWAALLLMILFLVYAVIGRFRHVDRSV